MRRFWALMARFFNNYKVALCPGVTGKQLALWLDALNDRMRPLYDLHDLPCGFANRYCIGAASVTWGGRPSDSDYVLAEQDFLGWTPNHFDSYTPPCDWSREAKARPAAHIETWRINAQNMTTLFPAVYGAEHLLGLLSDVEDIRALHVREPRKFTLSLIRGARGTLNYRWIQELNELTNTIRLYAKVERPTFEQLKAIGVTINPVGGQAIFRRPDTFQIRDPIGYFRTEIVRK